VQEPRRWRKQGIGVDDIPDEVNKDLEGECLDPTVVEVCKGDGGRR